MKSQVQKAAEALAALPEDQRRDALAWARTLSTSNQPKKRRKKAPRGGKPPSTPLPEPETKAAKPVKAKKVSKIGKKFRKPLLRKPVEDEGSGEDE